MKWIACALMALIVVVGGCASGRARPDAAHLPDDFSLSVSVLPGEGRGAAWYIVEPDGTLRAALGQRRADSPRPGAVRVLSRGQVRGVWELAVAAGLVGEAARDGRVSRTAPGSPSGAAVVEVSAAGDRRMVVAPVSVAGGGERFRALEERLRSLAWVEEQ